MKLKTYKRGLYWDLVEEAEISIIEEALRENGGSITKTAVALGLARTQLSAKVHKLGIKGTPKALPSEGNEAWKAL